jgi:CRP-like cAMP-binding protein
MTGWAAAAQSSTVKSRFFEGLAPADVKAIVAAANWRRFPARCVVIEQDTPADRMFLLMDGRARHFFVMEDGRKIHLIWRVAGDIFGGAALLSAYCKYMVGTETVSESSALEWDRATIRRLAARHPRLLENGLLIATDYLRWHLTAHVALASHSARRRLADVVVALAHVAGRKMPRGIALRATNEELANAAHVSLFTASRLMSEWERQGALVKERGRVMLRSPDRLLWSG